VKKEEAALPPSVLLVHDVDVVLDGGVAGADVEPVRAQQRVAAGEAEGARAADDGELAHGVERAVPAEQRQRAAVVGPRREHQVHGLQEAEPGLVGPHVQPLGAADGGGALLGPLRQRVVHHVHHPEHGHRRRRRGRRRLHHAHRRRRLAAHRVVEVELEVRRVGRLLLAPPGAVDSVGFGDQGEEEHDRRRHSFLRHL
jgi:hypothetical protein